MRFVSRSRIPLLWLARARPSYPGRTPKATACRGAPVIGLWPLVCGADFPNPPAPSCEKIREKSMKRLLVVLFALLACAPAWAGKKPLYTYFRVGNPNDIVTAVSPGVVLMGGGTDVDAAFQWMCSKAGNGDFLVIRATGTDAYNPYIQDLCPL